MTWIGWAACVMAGALLGWGLWRYGHRADVGVQMSRRWRRSHGSSKGGH